MKRFKYVFIIVISIISILFLLSTPTITLEGKEEMTINLYEDYKEPGYFASYIMLDKTKLVKTVNNINNKKTGNYKVVYSLKINKKEYKKTRIIHVIDNVSPTITLKGNNEYCPNKEYIEEGFTAIDNYDGDITDKVKIEKNENTITYKVKDKSSNKFEITRKIKPIDSEKPVITLNGDSNLTIYINSNYEEPGYIVSDNCSDLNDKVEITGSVNTKKEGKYILTYKAIDDSGNTTTITRTINVINKKDEGVGKTIYLTFDDGPSSSITPQLLQILKEENVQVTFFVINRDDSLNYLIKREQEDGHVVALHSFTHDYSYVYSSIDNYFSDLNLIREKVYSITGNYSNLIRFPGGSSNTVSRKYYNGIMSILVNEVENRGYHYFDWNVSSGDAGGSNNSSEVYNSVVNNLIYKNNIVLLHDFEGNYKTLNAIRDIIRFGKQKGYTFSTLNESSFTARHGVNN